MSDESKGLRSGNDLLIVLLIVLLLGTLWQFLNIGQLQGELTQQREQMRRIDIVISEWHAYIVSLRSKMIAHGIDSPEPPRRTANE